MPTLLSGIMHAAGTADSWVMVGRSHTESRRRLQLQQARARVHGSVMGAAPGTETPFPRQQPSQYVLDWAPRMLYH